MRASTPSKRRAIRSSRTWRRMPPPTKCSACARTSTSQAMWNGSPETQGRKEVPTIDIQKTCQLAAGAMVKLMGGTTTEQDINACLDSEQKARDQIVKDLATYASADKVQCMRTDVYLPSYVEWLTCLEMGRDVRKMQREDQFGTGPDTGSYTLPKVRSAINEGRTVSAGVLEGRANDSAQRASKPARAVTRMAPPRKR